MDIAKELAAARKAAKKKKPAKAAKKKPAKKAKVDLADRVAAEKVERIGAWAIHHDKQSGGVAAQRGSTIHIFTGKMAKASAVAFAKKHTEKNSKAASPAVDAAKVTPHVEKLNTSLGTDDYPSVVDDIMKNRTKPEILAIIRGCELHATPSQSTKKLKDILMRRHEALLTSRARSAAIGGRSAG